MSLALVLSLALHEYVLANNHIIFKSLSLEEQIFLVVCLPYVETNCFKTQNFLMIKI